MAMSHYHADHTANANAFAKSTWIVQQADYDMMFKPGDIPIRAPETYKDLKDSKLIMLHNEDHDVFGDGTVIIKTAPGHTPGHQMLFLKLKKFGPLLLAGDLYHLPEERTLDRVPTFDYNADMTRATRKKVEEFLSTPCHHVDTAQSGDQRDAEEGTRLLRIAVTTRGVFCARAGCHCRFLSGVCSGLIHSGTAPPQRVRMRTHPAAGGRRARIS